MLNILNWFWSMEGLEAYVKHTKLCQNFTNAWWGQLECLEWVVWPPSGVWVGQLLESWWAGWGVIKGVGWKESNRVVFTTANNSSNNPLTFRGQTSFYQYKTKSIQNHCTHDYKNVPVPYLCTQKPNWVVFTIADNLTLQRAHYTLYLVNILC